MKEIPKLTLEIRKIVAEVGKRARSKQASFSIRNEYMCKMEEVYNTGKELL